MSKKGLGKGLGALIRRESLPEVINSKHIQEIPIRDVKPNPKQPRIYFDQAQLEELSLSIKEHGIIQPIIVQGQNNEYLIVAGERRWRAAQLAGLEKIPVIVKELTGKELSEIALIENLQREDLNPIEEAIALGTLIKDFDLTQELLAQRIGKSRPYVANSLRLLQLPVEVRNLILDRSLSAGHGRALGAIKDSKLICELAKRIIEQGLNVRQTESLVKANLNNVQAPAIKTQSKPKIDPNISELEDKLRGTLGTGVRIYNKGKKGKIEIEYYGEEDLNRILETLLLKDME